MKACYSIASDFDAWIALARGVEYLFGPMADEASFKEALKEAILNDNAFCLRSGNNNDERILKGGIIISRESNKIVWFAVSGKYRNNGYGKELLGFAIDRLDKNQNILVQTFDKTVPVGHAARQLYLKFGFTEFEKAGLNPAGMPTVMMQIVSAQKLCGH